MEPNRKVKETMELKRLMKEAGRGAGGVAEPSPSPATSHNIKEAMELKRMREDAAGRGVAGVPEPTPSPSSQNISVTISMQGEKEEQFKQAKKSIDHPQLGQWLRAAVLGANDGLVTTASLMMGVGAVEKDTKYMVLSGLAALVAGACSMAIGEFVSVQAQRDVEISNLKRNNNINKGGTSVVQKFEPSTPPVVQKFKPSTPSVEAQKNAGSPQSVSSTERKALSNPLQAACASAFAFSVGALVPLISAAFIKSYAVRVGVLAGVSSLALVTFGTAGAYFSRAHLVKGALRVLVGGWLAMSITYGVLKLFHRTEGGDDDE